VSAIPEEPVRPTFPIVLLVLGGCLGRNIPYEGGPGGEDTTVTTSTCGEDADLEQGFAVKGATLDLGTGGSAAAGLCIRAVDPTPAITGGAPTLLASSEVCDDGTYVVAGVASVPAIGMFLLIDDCEGAADTVMLTATGISPDTLAGLGDGDALEGIEALSVSLDWVATEQADLEALGWSGDLATSGYMAGLVEDAGGDPVAGATVACAGCVPAIYYEDGDASDGIYGQGATANTATTVEGSGIFMIPAAPIFSYTCDDGGAHTWESTLLGSLPAYAVYIRFTAQ
jgi:hypothetical protein